MEFTHTTYEVTQNASKTWISFYFSAWNETATVFDWINNGNSKEKQKQTEKKKLKLHPHSYWAITLQCKFCAAPPTIGVVLFFAVSFFYSYARFSCLCAVQCSISSNCGHSAYYPCNLCFHLRNDFHIFRAYADVSAGATFQILVQFMHTHVRERQKRRKGHNKQYKFFITWSFVMEIIVIVFAIK